MTVGSKGSGRFMRAGKGYPGSDPKLILILVAVITCIFCRPLSFASEISIHAEDSNPAKTLLAQAGEARAVSSSSSPFDELKVAYRDVKSLEAQFRQKIVISSLKKERESRGEFFFKRQKGFLWRYKTPKVQYFLYDGKFLWQGEDEKPHILKDKIDRDKTGGTFFDLVEDIAKIDELFTLKEEKIERDLEVLELVPKKEGSVTAARVWIDRQKRVKKIEIREFTGNINTIEFSEIKVNQPMDDGRFVFAHDGKKEIVER